MRSLIYGPFSVRCFPAKTTTSCSTDTATELPPYPRPANPRKSNRSMKFPNRDAAHSCSASATCSRRRTWSCCKSWRRHEAESDASIQDRCGHATRAQGSRQTKLTLLHCKQRGLLGVTSAAAAAALSVHNTTDQRPSFLGRARELR